MIIVSLSNYNLYNFASSIVPLVILIAANSDFSHLSPVSWQVPQPQEGAGLSARGLCWLAGTKKKTFFSITKSFTTTTFISWKRGGWMHEFLGFFCSKKSWESIRSIFAWVCFFRRPASTLKQKGCFRFSNLSPVPLEVQHFEASLILLSETSRSWKKNSFALPKNQISFSHLTQTFLPSVYVLES